MLRQARHAIGQGDLRHGDGSVCLRLASIEGDPLLGHYLHHYPTLGVEQRDKGLLYRGYRRHHTPGQRGVKPGLGLLVIVNAHPPLGCRAFQSPDRRADASHRHRDAGVALDGTHTRALGGQGHPETPVAPDVAHEHAHCPVVPGGPHEIQLALLAQQLFQDLVIQVVRADILIILAGHGLPLSYQISGLEKRLHSLPIYLASSFEILRKFQAKKGLIKGVINPAAPFGSMATVQTRRQRLLPRSVTRYSSAKGLGDVHSTLLITLTHSDQASASSKHLNSVSGLQGRIISAGMTSFALVKSQADLFTLVS